MRLASLAPSTRFTEAMFGLAPRAPNHFSYSVEGGKGHMRIA